MNGVVSVSTSRRYRVVSALLAFALWGGWAFWVNAGHEAGAQRLAAITQGSASFLITLLMTHAVSILFTRLQAHPLRAIAPAVMTVSVTGTLLVTAHYLAGTPEILYTVTPALSVAFIYCYYTTRKLMRLSEGRE